MVRSTILAALVFSCLVAGKYAESLSLAAGGELEIRVLEKKTGLPTAVRMHVVNRRGKPFKPKGVPYWRGGFVFGGNIVLKLPKGAYRYVIERGPEYRVIQGHFIIAQGAGDTKVVEMERFVDMKKEGWWSGELHIHRSLENIELLMLAEDLHIAPVITWWNNRNLWQDKKIPEKLLVQFDENRFYHLMAGEDEREGGALLYFNLKKPLDIVGSEREYPSPVKFLKQARGQESLHVDIEKPFWWDMPIWIASGMTHSIGLANNHMQREGMLANEAWGKPRDKVFYPDPEGNGRWTQDIYYHLLNCGLRIPPSAGSASGVLNNPLGYNRVYVHCEGELTYEKWWEGLRAGRVVVTNGPLLRPKVNGKLPGHVFEAAAGEEIELDIALNLSLRDKVEYLEIIKNGKVVHEVRLAKWAKDKGKLPPISFRESGWMLVRAVARNDKTFRFGATGPYYVQIGDQPRVSKESAQFFVDWVHQRAGRVKIADLQQHAEVLKYHRAARDYWLKILNSANAE